MKKGIYLLPNLVTMGNMFCGFFAIIMVFNANYQTAAVAILVAALFDGLDGKVARMTNTTSRFGVEFDSLADLVSFGVAPGLLIYAWALKPYGRFGVAAAFLFAVCGALRLARYNVQASTSESKSFTGLPIPAAAGTISSVVIIHNHFLGIEPRFPFLLMMIAYVLAFLMVSTIKYHSAKEFELKKRKSFNLLVTASLILFLFVAEPQIMLFLFSFVYVSSGIVGRVFFAHRAKAPKVQQPQPLWNKH